MLEILTVCTGNVCRSPLAEAALATALPEVRVASAGTRALIGAPMDKGSVRLAREHGIRDDIVLAHRGRWLSENDLRTADLVLAMSREHRRAAVELMPGALRRTFTVREFARLATTLSDEEATSIADAAGLDTRSRMTAILTRLASMRGDATMAADPADDDVVDPYRREWPVYEQMDEQLTPALAEVVRVLRLVSG